MSFTAIQATLAIIIVLTSIPINLLLIAAMIVHRKDLDKSFIVAISVLISNIIVTVFFTGEIAITSIARSWLFGYWGCQIIAFIGCCGLISRWMVVGLVSLDRFSRVFWTFVYQRHEKKIIISLLVTSWTIAIIHPTVLWSCDSFVFNIAVPGCLYTESPETTKVQAAVVHIGTTICLFFGLLLPGVLYTIMYCKARQIRKKNRVAPISTENPDTTSAREAQRRANRATLTYVLMMVAFIAVNIPIVVNVLVRLVFHISAPSNIIIPISFLFRILVRSYVLIDVVIILTDKQHRDAVKKLWKLMKTRLEELQL